MNKQLYTLFALAALITGGCRKVEKHDEFLHTIYSVITEANLYREDGSFLFYSYTPGNTPRVPGDTLTIAGILGGKDVQVEIKIGDSTVSSFNRQQFRIYNTSVKDTVWTMVDYLQCIIPKGVTGNTVPVSLYIKGSTIQAPALKIQQFTDIPSATDTTLIVEKVGEWLPADMAPYAGNDLWSGGTVTNAGNVWFFNKVDGIFEMSNGAARLVLPNGKQITPLSGTPFTIERIIGFTVDVDETALYFSAATTEATADGNRYYITRLCKMDPRSGAVEVVNRSTFMKLSSQYGRAADLVTTLYNPADNYLPAEGNVADIKLALVNLHITLDGTLYGSNSAYYTQVFPKSPLADDPGFPQFSDPAWYAQRDSVLAQSWYGYPTGNISSGMLNFIRISNGQVRSLAKADASYPVPGAIYYYANQQLSPDGKYIYEINPYDRVLTIISTDDFENETLGRPGAGDFSFSSLDRSEETGLHTPTIQLDDDRFGTYYVLSNRDVVLLPSAYQGISVLALNFAAHNAYAYAGTEKGLKSVNGSLPFQEQTTGLAKWVNFSPARRTIYGNAFFTGFDRRNSLYFVYINYSFTGGEQQYLPVEVYRIKKP